MTDNSFGKSLYRARTEKGLTQSQLAGMLFVDRSTVNNWENGRRMPDAAMIARLSQALDTDVSALLLTAKTDNRKPIVVLIDDEKIILKGSLAVIKKTFTGAEVFGFENPLDAIDFCKNNTVSVVFCDIEMGNINGFELCGKLLEINPKTNVIFLTAYCEHALNAWETGACGFIVKPINQEKIKTQLSHLRYPVGGLL